MAPMTPDLFGDLRRRRAAGERVSVLARELGIAWQKLEKLTRLARRPLPDDPVLVRRELRYTRLMLESVPHLGTDRPWALAWRERLCQRFRLRIQRLRRRLADLRGELQVPEEAPVFWKPRPATAADARIQRRFDPKGTMPMWGEP